MTSTPTPSRIAAGVIPIIDLHFHADSRWDIGELVNAFDQLGVARAGNGAIGLDTLALDFDQRYPGRFIPFAGTPLVALIRDGGRGVWELQSLLTLLYLSGLEVALQAGSFKGIGELFANNLLSHGTGAPASRYPADSPLMRRLWALSATYSIPLSVHMEATGDSVAEMERLLASDRKGTWIWAHTGHYAEPPLVKRLLQTHPNLYCELSYRGSIYSGLTRLPIDTGGQLRPEWKALLEEFPDRFVLGTDVGDPIVTRYIQFVQFWRAVLSQLSPETAAKVAHQNAERLLKLPPTQ